MIREEIAKLEYGKPIPKECPWNEVDSYTEWKKSVVGAYRKTDQILSLITTEIEKALLGDEEIDDAVCGVYPPYYAEGEEPTLAQGSIESQHRRLQRVAVAQAQLGKILNLLKEQK